MKIGQHVVLRERPDIPGVVTAMRRGKAQVHWCDTHTHTWNWQDALRPAQRPQSREAQGSAAE